ncbi:hypothetical protein Tco_0825245 [Tanacetum coccineum]
MIVEYKIIKEGIIGHYQLIRADGSSKRYSSMIRMLQGIDREDLETLWKLVKTKHGNTRPEDEHERVLWGDLKVMFEPDIKSVVWRNLQGYKVTIWKLFDSCGVHFVSAAGTKSLCCWITTVRRIATDDDTKCWPCNCRTTRRKDRRRTGRGGGRTRGRSGDQGNGRIDGQGGQVGGQAQVGNQGSNQGNPRNQNDDAVNDNIQGDVKNVIVNKNQKGCTYKKFLACNLKEYDGKGGAIVYTRWIEKIDSLQDMSGCEENQKIYGLAPQMVAAKEPPTIQKAVQKDGTLIDEAIRNGSQKKNPKKRGNGGEPNRDRNARDENKRTRTGNTFATTANPVNARNPTAALGACFECGGTDHFKVACPRLNQAQRPGETVQTKLLLIMGDKVMGTTITRHMEGHLCWE